MAKLSSGRKGNIHLLKTLYNRGKYYVQYKTDLERFDEVSRISIIQSSIATTDTKNIAAFEVEVAQFALEYSLENA